MERVGITVTGGCQCGAVRYRATAMLDNAHLCHCRMCQKATGGLFAALVAAPNDALSWTRGTPATFRSSAHVDRGFCAACGTPLFYRGDTGRTNLTIGSLDDPFRHAPRWAANRACQGSPTFPRCMTKEQPKRRTQTGPGR